MERILVIQTAFLGDAILTLPMIEKLHELNPGALIDVIGIPGTKEIFANSPFVNEVLVFEKRGKHKSPAGIYAFAKELKEKGYSKIFSPHRSFRTSLLVWLTQVKETYGFDTASLSFVYKYKIKYRPDYHEVRRLLEIIKPGTGDNEWKIIPRIKENKKTDEKIDDLLKGITGKIVAIAPGSVWETKKYPAESYSRLAKLLTEEGYSVVLLGSKEDTGLCSSIAGTSSGSIHSFAGKLTLTESVYLLKKCVLLISNDSAPTHMSLLASTPVLTVYCSTIPAFGFYPYHLNSISVSYDNLSCKPCGIHGLRKCPIGTFECASKVPPESLFEKVKSLLA